MVAKFEDDRIQTNKEVVFVFKIQISSICQDIIYI